MMLDRLKRNLDRKRAERIRARLPWYASGCLSPEERRSVETWLDQDAGLAAELDFWSGVQDAVAEQGEPAPPARVWQQVEASVQSRQRRDLRSMLPRMAGSSALALVVLVLAWALIQPGIQLEWAVDGGPAATFRVYRAPEGSADFGLLGEVPAEAGVVRYEFVDARVLPAQAYVYRVEAVGAEGVAAASRALTTDAVAALPSQLVLLAASLMVGYGSVSVVPRLLPAGRGRLPA